MTPTIDEILNFSIDYLYCLFNHIDDKGVRYDILFAAEYAIIKKFFPEIKFNPREEIAPLKRLFSPIYWHFLDNYSLQNQVVDENRPPNNILYWKLEKPLPSQKEFKKELLEQGWVIPYLQANLNNIYKTI